MENKKNANVRARELAKLIEEVRKDGLQVATTTDGNIAVINGEWQYKAHDEVRDQNGFILPCYYTEIGMGHYIPLPHGKDGIIR